MKRYILPLLASGMCLTATAGNDIINLLVGTYTNTGSKGIYSFSFDQTSGESMLLDVAETDNPSFLTLSPDKRTNRENRQTPLRHSHSTRKAAN